jgi:tRNA threonylcarbamoyladenosine biosynthesis protein TsaB
VAATARGKVLAALDAGRSEAYVGEYELEGRLVSPERLLKQTELVQSANGRSLATPDKVVADTARAAGLPVLEVERPTSAAIARLAWKKLRAGDSVSVADLEANYIRRSDAEIFSKNN